MSFLDKVKDDSSKSSHEQLNKAEIETSEDKLKPRFSINLSEADFQLVKEYCKSRGIPAAVLARLTLLDKVKGN